MPRPFSSLCYKNVAVRTERSQTFLVTRKRTAYRKTSRLTAEKEKHITAQDAMWVGYLKHVRDVKALSRRPRQDYSENGNCMHCLYYWRVRPLI